MSRSHSERPICRPSAKRNVFAIAPATTRISTLPIRKRNRWSLVDTLAPPISARTGRLGVSRAAVKAVNAAGKLMQAELTALTAALETPRRPVLALIGGAKVSTKLHLLRFLIGKVDILVVAGAMANTFLFAEGRQIGRSLCERDMANSARETLLLAHQRNCRVVQPEDVVVAPTLGPGVTTRTVRIEVVPSDMMILDVGPVTVARIGALLGEVRTLVWNGPLGAFEMPPFDRGTVAVAKKIGALTG